MKAELCPVCQGRQTVPAGFYSPSITTNAAPEVCRSCNGLGYIVLSISTTGLWDVQGADNPDSETTTKQTQ